MKEITALSFGAGKQSTALLVMSNLGLYNCPRADLAIFADTQAEPSWVYEHLRLCQEWSEIPVLSATGGSLIEATVRRHMSGGRFAAIPAFTSDTSGRPLMLRRQCTREYKIDVIKAELRKRLGLLPRQRAVGRVAASCMIGISVDEVHRAAPSRDAWITNVFPLLDAGLRRSDCEQVIRQAGLPVPKKSSCTVCPYHSDAYWLDLKTNHPEEWSEACAFDDAIRDMSMSGVERPVYLHRSLVPLRVVTLRNESQLSLWGAECGGHCGL